MILASSVERSFRSLITLMSTGGKECATSKKACSPAIIGRRSNVTIPGEMKRKTKNVLNIDTRCAEQSRQAVVPQPCTD